MERTELTGLPFGHHIQNLHGAKHASRHSNMLKGFNKDMHALIAGAHSKPPGAITATLVPESKASAPGVSLAESSIIAQASART